MSGVEVHKKRSASLGARQAGGGAVAVDAGVFIFAGAKTKLLELWGDNAQVNLFSYSRRLLTVRRPKVALLCEG
jgi:hypothetical protein